MPTPSIAIRKPATSAQMLEWKINLADFMVNQTAAIPNSATTIRQPNGLPGPKTSIPKPISHLPKGG